MVVFLWGSIADFVSDLFKDGGTACEMGVLLTPLGQA